MLDHVRSTGNGHFDVFRHDLGIFPSLSISSTWKPHHHCARLGHGPATDRAWSPVLGGFMQKKHPNAVMWCNANIYCHTLYHLIMSTIWWVLYLQKHKHVILTDLCKYSLKHHNRKAFPMWFFSVCGWARRQRPISSCFQCQCCSNYGTMNWFNDLNVSNQNISSRYSIWLVDIGGVIPYRPRIPGWTFRNI